MSMGASILDWKLRGTNFREGRSIGLFNNEHKPSEMDDAMPRMTYEAIQKQLAKLQAQAAKMELAQGAAKKKSVAKVVALMKKLGISIEDLKGAEPVKPAKAGRKPSAKKTPRAGNRSKVAAKYQHPETGATWTGRGLPPKWLADEIAAGKSKEQFLIQQASPTPETEAPH